MTSQTPSPKYALDKTDIKETAWHILLLFIAWVIEIVSSEIIPQLESLETFWSGLVVTGIYAVLELARKWLKDNQTPKFMLIFLVLSLSPSLAYAQLDVQPKAKLYEPIVVTHDSGVQIQVLPWGTALPEFLDERFVRRFDTHTVWGGPPGAYLVTGMGDLKIVLIEGTAPTPTPGPTPTPTPGPTPVPGPTPPPNVPDGKWGVGPWIYSQVVALDPTSKQYIKGIADNFESIIGGARAGRFTGLSEAQTVLGDMNRKLFGTADRTAWEVVLNALGKRMVEQRVPNTLEAYTEYYEELLTGLRAAQ